MQIIKHKDDSTIPPKGNENVFHYNEETKEWFAWDSNSESYYDPFSGVDIPDSVETALLSKADKVSITGATKTKISYNSQGIVTSGTDATTADISDSTNKRYVTDSQLTVIGNTSGTNTGDETTATIKSKLGITTLSGSNTGDQDLSGLQTVSQKDASNGYVGLTLLKINFKNVANTITSFFTNSNTAARTYTFPDRNGTIADDADITDAKNRSNHTGTQTASTISNFNSAALSAAPAETTSSIGSLLHASTNKTTPIDADEIGIWDSISGLLNRLSFSNLKTYLKAYFDTLYPLKGGSIIPNDLTGRIVSGSGSVGYVLNTSTNHYDATYSTGSGGSPRSAEFTFEQCLPRYFTSFPSSCFRIKTSRNVAMTTFEVRCYNDSSSSPVTSVSINPTLADGNFQTFNVSIGGSWSARDWIKVSIFMASSAASGTIRVEIYDIIYD